MIPFSSVIISIHREESLEFVDSRYLVGVRERELPPPQPKEPSHKILSQYLPGHGHGVHYVRTGAESFRILLI